MAAQEIPQSGNRTVPRTITLTDPSDHAAAIKNTGGSDWVKADDFKRGVSILADNGASATCTFTVETSIDGTNWVTLAFGDMNPASGAAVPQYGVAARTLAASAKTTIKLPLADIQVYVRVNVSSANSSNGTTFTLLGKP